MGIQGFMKKFIGVLCAALTLSGCSVPFFEDDYKPPTQYELYQKITVEDDFDCNEEFEWYPQFCSDLLSLDTDVTINQYVKKSDVKTAVAQLRDEFPEIFWLDGYYYRSHTSNIEVEFELVDGVEEDTLAEMHEELVSAANEIIGSIPEDADDYEKMLIVHDAIAEGCVYDHEGADRNENGLFHSAYGALVDGKAVCSGYAEAFGYIMGLLDIESGICSGYTEGNGYHAWNYVKLDGKYYWVDVTWDDIEGYSPSHQYFMFDDSIMSRTRWLTRNQNFAPNCDSLDEYYPVKNGGYFEKYSFDEVKKYVGKCKGSYCDITFADFDAYSKAHKDLIGEHKLTKLTKSKNARYYADDRMMSITVYLD